jgi:hypothetical protein
MAEFLPVLHSLVKGRRLITVERAEIIYYQPQSTPPDERPATSDTSMQ